jgi:PKD repeat protein
VTISPAPNQPPVAVVNGPYVGVVGQVITFTSTGSSDPEGGQLTYAWNFGDGTSASVASPTHSYGAALTYTVTLTVTDSANATASASTTATISAPVPNQLPTVSSVTIPSAGLLMQNMVVNAVASDPDGDVLTYRWNFGDGSPEISGLTAPALHEYGATGSYNVTVTVDDAHGGVASASGTIAITAPSGPIAYSRNLLIPPRQQAAIYKGQYAVELDGAGVPPLQFRITTFPTHIEPSMDVFLNRYYQWWDPLGVLKPECRRSSTQLPLYCKASFSSRVDMSTGTVTMNPTTVPPTVVYAPQLCYVWIGPISDSFAFTVTDATGATSDPALINITIDPNQDCLEPTF